MRVVNRHLASVIRLQRLTGARSGEILTMRACDIDTSLEAAGTPLWVYRPARHKTSYRGQRREVFLGPRAQEVIRPFLAGDPNDYLFSRVVVQ